MLLGVILNGANRSWSRQQGKAATGGDMSIFLGSFGIRIAAGVRQGSALADRRCHLQPVRSRILSAFKVAKRANVLSWTADR
jgi:hypothetical protein